MWEEKVILLQQDRLYAEGIPNFVVATIDDWPLKVLFVYAYLLVGISYILTIFFNLKVYYNLKSMENQMSFHAKDANKQISTILIVQAVVPGIICLFPIALAVTLAFLHTNIPGIGLCLGLTFSIIPSVNPFLTLVVVRNYRRAIMTNLEKVLPCVWIFKKLTNQSSSTAIHPTHQSSTPSKEIFHIQNVDNHKDIV
uniref:Uncharacterized protein n=1 Tax=Panagrolaimus sp. JU765 TaxID=591449 RepID=A0AC34Q787_9BILA